MDMTAPVFALTHLDSSYRPDRIGMCFWLTQDIEVTFVSSLSIKQFLKPAVSFVVLS